MRILLLFIVSLTIRAENISLEEAESLFFNNNLELAANAFEAQASKDLISKERTWDNPNFSFQEGLKEINNQFQISQSIVVAKRAKRVKMAKLDAQIAELDLNKNKSSLRLELQRSFFTLYFLNQSKDFYDKSISSLSKTVDAAQRIYEKRLILLAEVMRLRTLLLTLQTEHFDLLNQISEEEAQFATLLGIQPGQKIPTPAFDINTLFDIKIDPYLSGLIDDALQKRFDFQIAKADVSKESANLSLQRSLWVPDFNLQLSYQQAGNNVPDYFGLQIAFDIPLLNQNLAGIRNSKNLLNAKQKRQAQIELTAKHEIEIALEKAKQSTALLKQIDPKYTQNYEQLVEGMTRNYQRGNIDIIAFADFYESYRDSITKMNQTLLNCTLTFEEFNYAVGQDKIKL